ncbi:MAG: LysR family transcriptional regulator, partial [Pseudomonadales bacterium]
LRVIELGALTFHRELVALLRRAQRQPALDCLLSCLESIN